MIETSAALARAVVAQAAAAGCPVEIVSAHARDWASATFTGQRHRLRLRAPPGPALTAWIAALPEAEWRLPRNIVAYIAAEESGGDVNLSALTIHES